MKEDGELPSRVKVRSSQYLNNLVEQDHRRVKQRIRPIVGLVNSSWLKMTMPNPITLEFDYESGAPPRAVAPRTWIGP
jgi:hypothetical protein